MIVMKFCEFACNTSLDESLYYTKRESKEGRLNNVQKDTMAPLSLRAYFL